MKDINLTSIFFVSAKNLEKTINKIIEIMGNREISICKEITKLNEQVIRSDAKMIPKLLKENKFLLKGEFTLIISDAITTHPKINESVTKELIRLLKKYNLTEVVKIVHSLTGIAKKDIYKTALKYKND